MDSHLLGSKPAPLSSSGRQQEAELLHTQYDAQILKRPAEETLRCGQFRNNSLRITGKLLIINYC
jgi:hypothetical protein